MSEVDLRSDVTVDNLADFEQSLELLTGHAILVGFPADEPARENEDGTPAEITNAALGYIHDKGSPEQNIPARPFMEPGIESRQEQIADNLEHTGIVALDGKTDAVMTSLAITGQIAEDGIKAKILDGPFAPLSDATLRARARKGGSIGAAAQAELDGVQLVEGSPNVRPLNETGQMRNAVRYVIAKASEVE